jgi:hypothetical protein
MASELILTGLASIANDWKTLAIVWHFLLAGLFLVLMANWRPSVRLLGGLLTATVFSVSVVAWLSGNPFNGTMFALIAGALAWAAGRLPARPIRFARRGWAAAGVTLIVFGSTYPHFLRADSWVTYLYAAPFGVLPCPTLAVMVGMALLIDDLPTAPWSVILVVASAFYGGFGVAWLGVQLDWTLLLGSAMLAAILYRKRLGPRALACRAA